MNALNWLLVTTLAVLGSWGLVRAILRIRREERERAAFAAQQRAAEAAWKQLGDAYRAVDPDAVTTGVQCRNCLKALAECRCPCPKVLIPREGQA